MKDYRKVSALSLIGILFVSSIAVALPENPEGLVKRAVKKEVASEEVLPMTYAQVGATSEGAARLRFATPINVKEATDVTYTRSIDGMEDNVVEVKSVYKGIEADGTVYYYDGNNVTEEPVEGDYYWANYMIEFDAESSHKSTMITAKLDVDGKEAPFLTTSYNAVASADKVTATFVDENGTLLGRSVVISGDVPVYAGEALDASKAWLVDNVVYGALPTITSNTTFKVVSPMVLTTQYDIDLSQDVSSWSVPEITEDTITAVKVGTNEVTFTQNGSNIVVDNYDAITAGEYVMTLVGEKGVYVANMAVATKVIYTAADWMQVGVRTASNPDMVGYYTLGADIDFTGIEYVQDTSAYWGSTNGLKGTFNGRNHSINNLVMGTDNNSFFGTVCIGSVVKNVEINATIAWGSVGVISNLMYGTAQNVSVNLTTNGGWWNGAIARFLRSEARVDHCMIKVDGVASAADYRGAISSLVQDASVITNTYVISENFPLGYMGPDSPGAELTETATFKKYANVQAMANANVDLTSWDVTTWDVTNGYPVFKKEVA